MLLARRAGGATAAAHIPSAGSARGIAVVAQVAVAPLAEGSLTIADEATAVGAGDAVPLVERDVGRVGVVGGQRLGDDHKEVEDPAGGERRPQGAGRLPLAESLVADMGMGDVRVAGGRSAAGGDDRVGGDGPEPVDLQHDFKGAQLHAVEDDRFGGHSYRARTQIDRHGRELTF